MKISQLIDCLTQIQERCGDIDVVCHKSGNYLDGVEKLVRLEAFWSEGPLPGHLSKAQRTELKDNPHLRADAGWLPVEVARVPKERLEGKTSTLLYIGPKMTFTDDNRGGRK